MIKILFEDEYIVCLDKPSMVLSQPSFDPKRTPIKELFEKQRPDLVGRLYLHHRLDFETSGVFLMSKAKEANKPLTEMFAQHDFKKTYHCLTRPNQLIPGKKVTCAIINDQEWKIENHMAPAKDLIKHKKRMISVNKGGWKAETSFQILRTTNLFHYVVAMPKTGRTHQIRQHLQESYRSILGDNIYGGKSPDVPRLMLHAYSLEFPHPITKKLTEVVATLPQDFQTCLNKQA